MSTLRTFNLQHPESSNNNIQLAEGGGVSVTAGILTATNVSSTNVSTTEVTATNGTFSGNLSVGGVLSYEDVTNVDSTGIGTFRDGLHVTGGSVGIGTDNPDQTLHLYDSTAFASFTNNADTGESGILFRRHDNNQNRGKVTYSFTDDALLFRASNDGSGENLRITSDGLLLLGTTNAGSNGTADDLVVANNSSASDQAGITIRGGTSGRSQIFFSDGTSGQDEYRGMLRYDHSENSMQFRTDAAERLRITSAGNIGINNQNPGDKLSISGGNLGIYNTGNNHGNVYFYKDGTAKGWLKYRGNDEKLVIGNVTDAINVLSSGDVGINESSPTRALSINGDMNLASGSKIESYSSGGNLQIQGGSTYPGGHIKMYGGSGNDMITFNTSGSGVSSLERLRITSDGKLGINVTSPGCQLGGIHAVHDATEGTPTFTGGEVGIFQRNYNSAQGCHIGIIGGSSGASSINFGDKDDADVGIIQYAHSDNSMRFYVSTNERMRILNDGMIETNGVMNYYASFRIANNGYYYWDIPVPNEGGYGNSFRCECGYNHYYTTNYGAHRSAWISSRGTSTNNMFDQDQGHSQSGYWSFSKPTNTSFRIEKSAGTYGGQGYGFIHVRFNSF